MLKLKASCPEVVNDSSYKSCLDMGPVTLEVVVSRWLWGILSSFSFSKLLLVFQKDLSYEIPLINPTQIIVNNRNPTQTTVAVISQLLPGEKLTNFTKYAIADLPSRGKSIEKVFDSSGHVLHTPVCCSK